MNLYEHYVVKRKDLHHLVVLFGLVALCAACLGGYFYYTKRYNEHAHKKLADAIEIFDHAQEKNSDELWKSADRALRLGYEAYPNSSYAPYFLVYRSQVALHTREIDDAISLLDQAVNVLPSKSLLQSYFKIKLALVKLDSNDAAVHEEGVQELQMLAGNPKNAARDMASYYYGLMNFDAGHREEAEKIWASLLEGGNNQQSVWANLAQAKLDYAA